MHIYWATEIELDLLEPWSCNKMQLFLLSKQCGLDFLGGEGLYSKRSPSPANHLQDHHPPPQAQTHRERYTIHTNTQTNTYTTHTNTLTLTRTHTDTHTDTQIHTIHTYSTHTHKQTCTHTHTHAHTHASVWGLLSFNAKIMQNKRWKQKIGKKSDDCGETT